MQQARHRTRPDLLVGLWWSPRRNRTGDPILTIDAPRVHSTTQNLCDHTTAQVNGAAEDRVVGQREVACSAASGKFLARAPVWSLAPAVC